MKRLRNDNCQFGEESACYEENVHVVINEALEKQRLMTDKKVALITTVANKMTSRWCTVRNRNIEMCDVN